MTLAHKIGVPFFGAFALLWSSVQIQLHGNEVLETARTLPVAAEVDVLVVGGSSGGVAAAVEAARNNAKVFLAAPRPYLGEDLCASYRLWLEPGETPSTDLARDMFQAAAAEAKVAGGVAFSYSASIKPFSRHADTTPPSLLSDSKWADSRTQSVQYDGDVDLILDLGKPQAIKKIHLMAFQRAQDFEVASVEILASDDKQTWKPAGTVKNTNNTAALDSAINISQAVSVTARYLKLQVRKSADADRVLLGEIILEGDAASPPPARAAATTGPITPATPMQIKRALDQALIKAGVQFLYGCYPTDVVVDAAGKPAGVVFANRSGRQVVIARTIIDATGRGTVARMAKATFTPFGQGPRVFQWNVLGGPAAKHVQLSMREPAAQVLVPDSKGGVHQVHEYTFRAPMSEDSFKAFAAAEQLARDLTWTKEQVDGSETLFEIPSTNMRGQARADGPWPGADKISLDVFKPAGVAQIFVLSGCADISREAAAELLRPINYMHCGARAGQAAAELARQTQKPQGVKLPGAPVANAADTGEVREVPAQHSPRYSTAATIPSEARGVPVLAEYDVIVVGGGTGGAPAAISAGRQGAKTLLVEYLHSLGGVGTVGLISIYYHGNRVGFTKEADAGVAATGGAEAPTKGGEWLPDLKAEWYRKEMRKAGVDIWLGTLGAGAYVENGRVRGIVVATPYGRGVVLAKVVIDSTGNADIAAAAGAEVTYTAETEIAVQGTGLPPRRLAPRYLNTDYTYVDETDIFDIWRVFVMSREKYKSAYDLGQLIDTRERRRIIGDVELTPLDAIQSRTWPDTIEIASSNFDSHGFTIHPLFLLRPPDKNSIRVPIPYRCLLPRGLDGILVTGLGVSAQRDALPLIRMQADIQNQGYAAGVAAAMASKTCQPTRSVDIKALQKHLVEKGNVPEKVLTDADSFPLPRERFEKAVAEVLNNYQGLEVLLTDPETAKPLLRNALKAAADPKSKRAYAHILGMLGDPAGTDVLIESVKSTEWDKGWQFKAMGQFGASVSPLDSLIIALGRCSDKRGTSAIVEKVRQLKAESDFSHFRAVSLALEEIADPAAALPLADLLKTPGIGGHALVKIENAIVNVPASGTDTATRRNELIEIGLARALLRCGDHEGLGEKTLRQYAQDLRGHYARHAQSVLAKAPPKN